METRVEAEVLQRDITQHKIGTHLTSAHFCMGTLLHRDTLTQMNTRNQNRCPHVKLQICAPIDKNTLIKYCCISEFTTVFHTVNSNNNFIFLFQNGSEHKFSVDQCSIPTQIKTVYDHYSFSQPFISRKVSLVRQSP